MTDPDLAQILGSSIEEATPHTRNVFGGSRAMSADEAQSFLHDTHVGLITTISRSGAPHVTAVYILALESSLYFGTLERTTLYRNLRRDPRVAIAVVELPWKRHAFIHGSVRFLSPEDSEEIDRVRATQRERFGGERGTVLCGIIPAKIFTWKM